MAVGGSWPGRCTLLKHCIMAFADAMLHCITPLASDRHSVSQTGREQGHIMNTWHRVGYRSGMCAAACESQVREVMADAR